MGQTINADGTLEQFNSSTDTLRKLYCSHGGTVAEFDTWLAQVPSRLGVGRRVAQVDLSEAGFRAAWEAAFASLQRSSNLTDWVRAAIDAYVASAEPNGDKNLTLIREARAEAKELRRYDDDMSERVSDLLVALASAIAAQMSVSDSTSVETDTLNEWVPAFLGQPCPPKGLSLDAEEAETHG